MHEAGKWLYEQKKLLLCKRRDLIQTPEPQEVLRGGRARRYQKLGAASLANMVPLMRWDMRKDIWDCPLIFKHILTHVVTCACHTPPHTHTKFKRAVHGTWEIILLCVRVPKFSSQHWKQKDSALVGISKFKDQTLQVVRSRRNYSVNQCPLILRPPRLRLVCDTWPNRIKQKVARNYAV